MHTATCHTEGCLNQDQAIVLDFLEPDVTLDFVVCGACGEPITDVVKAKAKRKGRK